MVKSTLIVLTSLIVAISVPWLAIAPTEMLRSETQPEKGARTTRSPIWALAWADWARAAAAAATWVSSADWVAKPRCLSSEIRASCCWASRARAWASFSWAYCWACWSTATIWPARTKLPSSKFKRTIRSVTGAETVTCSLARAVPIASIRSAKRKLVAASVLTKGAGLFLPFSASAPPQAAKASERTGRRKKALIMG